MIIDSFTLCMLCFEMEHKELYNYIQNNNIKVSFDVNVIKAFKHNNTEALSFCKYYQRKKTIGDILK